MPTDPSSGFSKFIATRSAVDFPAPFGPNSAVMLPLGTRNEMFLSTGAQLKPSETDLNSRRFSMC